MKTRWRIQLTLVSLGVIGMTLVLQSDGGEQTAAEETRFALHQQGFKTDLADFKSDIPKEMSDRAAILTLKNTVNPVRSVSFLNDDDLMTPVGESAALVIWKQAALANPDGFVASAYSYRPEVAKDVWPALRESLDKARSQLDAAAVALLSGPFQFDLNFGKGPGLPLPHLADMRYLAGMFAGRAILALHDHDQKAAWTNLLAATRVVTGWQMEPIEISQYTRFDCLETVYNLTWQALQSDDWPESDLANLQREWESLDLFASLPDTIAFAGACDVETYRQERLRDPSASDEVENELMLFGLERQVAIRNAIQAKTWKEMRHFPGVTNQVIFQPQGKGARSRTLNMMRTRRMTMAFESKGVGLIGRAAEEEARRRLVITAIAITRFHARYGLFPKSLAGLAPEFLKTVPADLMDGNPLRYSPGDDGHFLLYSIGLNCIDEGGKMSTNLDTPEKKLALMRGAASAMDGDLVWPRPASADAAKAHEEEKERQEELQKAAQAKQLADQEAEAEAARKAVVQELLTNPKYKKATWTFSDDHPRPLAYKGNPLEKVLLNQSAAGANSPSLDEMLMLKQVITGEEPEIITYRIPVSYDVVTNMRGGDIRLVMDSPPDETSEPGLADCVRATNGDCLLVWNTAFDSPGQHVLQVSLRVPTEVFYKQILIKGPVAPYFSSNLCQFFLFYSQFDDNGVNLDARLPESNGSYNIQIKSPAGGLLKTIGGSTTNAMINENWDLIDSQGRKYTNDFFEGFFTVKLPGSDRSQTLREPFNKLH